MKITISDYLGTAFPNLYKMCCRFLFVVHSVCWCFYHLANLINCEEIREEKSERELQVICEYLRYNMIMANIANTYMYIFWQN